MKDYEVLIHEFSDGTKLVLDTRPEEEIERERYWQQNKKFLEAQQRLLDVLNSIKAPDSWFNR